MKFTDDIDLISKLSDSQVDFLFGIINKYDLDKKEGAIDFQNSCKENNINFEASSAFTSIASYFLSQIVDSSNVEEEIKDLEEFLVVKYGSNENVLKFWKKIVLNLNKLESFIIKIKKRRLSNVLPNITEINFICDIRPIFNINKDKVVDYNYPVIIKIRQSYERKEHFFEITEEELTKLRKDIDNTINKLKILKKS